MPGDLARRAGRLTPQRWAARLEALDALAELREAKFPDDTPAARLRRRACAVVLPHEFGRTYLPHYFRDGGSPWHRLLLLAWEQERASVTRAPRGHAKTTTGTFCYTLHQVVCSPVLRAWEEGRLAETDPDLDREIRLVIDEEVAARLAEGPLSSAGLGLPEHWDPKVTTEIDAWLLRVYTRLAEARTIPLIWDPYIEIVAVDLATATEFLEAMRDELERNPLLRSDWGDLTPCHHQDWWRRVKRAASQDDWTSAGTRVRAFGMEVAIRGGRHGPWRPTLLIGDDLDSESSTRTEKQRARNLNLIQRGARRGLDEKKGRTHLVGTPVHSDCVVCRYSERDEFRGSWVSLRFRAMDESGRILYPQKWDAAALEMVRREDEEGYGSELDDRPPDDGSHPFKELHYYKRGDYREMRLTKVLFFDPAYGQKKTSCFQALVSLRGPTPDGAILVDRCELWRIPDPEVLVDQANQVYEEEHPDVAGIETIALGILLESLLVSRGDRALLFPSWRRVDKHEESKDARIRGLAPLNNRAKMLFPDDGSCRALERQFLGYPDGLVDGIDATEMGIDLLRKALRGSGLSHIVHVPRRSAAAFGAGAW